MCAGMGFCFVVWFDFGFDFGLFWKNEVCVCVCRVCSIAWVCFLVFMYKQFRIRKKIVFLKITKSLKFGNVFRKHLAKLAKRFPKTICKVDILNRWGMTPLFIFVYICLCIHVYTCVCVLATYFSMDSDNNFPVGGVNNMRLSEHSCLMKECLWRVVLLWMFLAPLVSGVLFLGYIRRYPDGTIFEWLARCVTLTYFAAFQIFFLVDKK